MTTQTHVPATVDAESITELVQDCREISGVLGGGMPHQRAVTIPDPRGAMPIEITPAAVLSLAGYDDYGC